MIIKKVAIGNNEEAYIEDSLSDGLNIILSDENNKGKTIVIQSILYAIGNKPIFPSSFDYKSYYYYLEFIQNDQEYSIVRRGDTFVFQSADGIGMFDSVTELKRFWTNNVFSLPIIWHKGNRRIVDMELFAQMFFVGQDGKDSSTIFNSGFYNKKDFENMILSYACEYSTEISPDEISKLKDHLKKLRAQRREKLKLSDFYKNLSPATEYLSNIKDQDAFNKRVSDIENIMENISEIRKKRNHIVSKKALWKGTLKELRSLNRNIEVGELRCMDCNSSNIMYKGKGKKSYSFDVSSPEMRETIISSIQGKIADIEEEIRRYDFEIQELQTELNETMRDDDITIENIVAYKKSFFSVEDIEREISNIDLEITEYDGKLKRGTILSNKANNEREDFHNSFVNIMNKKRNLIDPESNGIYTDMFTKRGSVISGSEETVFYVSKLLATAIMTKHNCPIIMDSFRAEDLSSDKEMRVLQEFLQLQNQCILTTTLKVEEKGKYDDMREDNILDYTNHKTNKILNKEYLEKFTALLKQFHIVL